MNKNFKQNNKITTIIFDLGNVVIDFNHWNAADKISNFCDYSKEEIYNMFFDSSLTQLFEKGRLTPEEFFLKVSKRLRCKISYKEFLPIWNEIFFLTANNLKIHRMIHKLKGSYKILLLSNINKLHFDYLVNNFNGIFNQFDKLILSYKVGARKPERKIYNEARKIAKTDFKNILYIDDRKELVEAATKLGIEGIHYNKRAELLQKRLSVLGIKI